MLRSVADFHDMKVADKYFDGIHIPYEDNVFDGVLCTQVLEHVVDIDLLLAECNRVIRLGGSLVVSVPFLYSEHEQPMTLDVLQVMA